MKFYGLYRSQVRNLRNERKTFIMQETTFVVLHLPPPCRKLPRSVLLNIGAGRSFAFISAIC
jgi:hypothetical protein